jgi:hypothetical protein
MSPITDKEWEEFGERMKKSAAKDAKMTDAEWAAVLDSLPEGDLLDEMDDEDLETTVAIAVKRR